MFDSPVKWVSSAAAIIFTCDSRTIVAIGYLRNCCFWIYKFFFFWPWQENILAHLQTPWDHLIFMLSDFPLSQSKTRLSKVTKIMHICLNFCEKKLIFFLKFFNLSAGQKWAPALVTFVNRQRFAAACKISKQYLSTSLSNLSMWSDLEVCQMTQIYLRF